MKNVLRVELELECEPEDLTKMVKLCGEKSFAELVAEVLKNIQMEMKV